MKSISARGEKEKIPLYQTTGKETTQGEDHDRVPSRGQRGHESTARTRPVLTKCKGQGETWTHGRTRPVRTIKKYRNATQLSSSSFAGCFVAAARWAFAPFGRNPGFASFAFAFAEVNTSKISHFKTFPRCTRLTWFEINHWPCSVRTLCPQADTSVLRRRVFSFLPLQLAQRAHQLSIHILSIISQGSFL